MKKIQLLWLVAAVLLGIGGSAKAELSATLTWDIPGSVEIYLGSTSDDNWVYLPAGATSYTGTLDQDYGCIYVCAADGYALESAACEEDDTLFPTYTLSGRQQINIDLAEHNGHTIKVNSEQIVYDASISINFVSAGNVTATFGGTGREYELQGFEQVVPFSTKFEKTISFSASPNALGSTFYIKQNEESRNWTTDTYGTLVHDDITLANGDAFEVKYNDEDPVPPVEAIYHNVTLDFGENNPRSLVSMIFNTTQMKRIPVNKWSQFQVKENDNIRFVFNTYDYTITVNGDELTPAAGETTPWLTGAVTEDIALNISAVWREYGTTMVQFSVTDAEGLVARAGALDGEPIDLSQITPTQDSFLGTDYYCYEVEVSEKSPKIFVEAAPGWWIQESVWGTSASDLVDSRMASLAQHLYIKMHKIVRDKQIAVNVNLGPEGSLSNFTLRNAQREVFPVAEGANFFYIDDIYDSPFTVHPIDIRLEDDPESGVTKDEFSIYNNYIPVEVDDESLTFKEINVTEGSVIYLFVKQEPLETYTVRVVRSKEAAESEVKYDSVRLLSAETYYKYGYDDSFQIFKGGEIEISPVSGAKVVIDDVVTDLAGSNSWKFSATANHLVVIGDTEPGEQIPPQTCIATPSDGSMVPELQTITLTFPYADSVELNSELYEWSDALFKLKSARIKYKKATWDGEVLADADVPTVVFTFTPAVTEEKDFQLILDEDFLLINGSTPFGGFNEGYTVKAPWPEESVTAPSSFDDGQVDPEAKVEFILLFSDAETVTLERQEGLLLQENSSNPDRYIEHPESVEAINASESRRIRYSASEADPAFRVTFPALNEAVEGKTFIFTADYGSFTVDDLPSPDIEKTFSGIITIVGTVEVDNNTGNVTVYGLDGRVLLNDAPASSLGTLPRGLYIVNGKKILK